MPLNLVKTAAGILLAIVLASDAAPADPGSSPESRGQGNVPVVFSLQASACPRPRAERTPGFPSLAGLPAAPARNHAVGSEVPPPHVGKKWGRSFLEFGYLFTFSAINYWRKYSMFIEDWQYEFNCKDQVKRFFTTDALKFDSNSFYLNWSHSMAGAVYYQFARTNHLTWLESWMFACGGSLLWEYGVEWREVVSISDNIFTGIGSFSIGEAWFQLGRYLNSRPHLVPRILGFLNPILKINQWLDRKNPTAKAYTDPGGQDFSVSAGTRRLSRKGRGHRDGFFFSLRGQITVPPEYGKPGLVRETLRNIFLSELTFDAAKGGNRDVDEAFLRGWEEGDLAEGGLMDEINFSTRVVGWARFRQNIDELGRGKSVTFGLGSAFSYFRKTPALEVDTGEFRVRVGEDLKLENPRFFRDKLSLVHVLGPVLDTTYFGRDLRLRASLEAYADFGLINSLALNDYSVSNDISGVKTTLLHYGYYYALGATLRGRLDLRWKAFRVRSEGTVQAWDSIEGLDRFQSDITFDCHANDSRTRWLVDGEWRPTRLPLALFAAYEEIRRRGSIEEFKVRDAERRAFVGLRFLY